MKTRFLSLPVLLVLALLFGTLGCLNGGGNSDNPVGPVPGNNPGLGNSPVGIAQSVQFRIVLPGQSTMGGIPAASLMPTIRASDLASVSVTFKLILVNVGIATNPTTILSKTVSVDGSGTAEVSFSSIPALTCIGDVHIAGGKIASYSDFHGTQDLLASAANVVFVSPKNSGTLEDILATILDRLTKDSEAFARVPSGLVRWLNLALSSFQGTDIEAAYGIARSSLLVGNPFQTSTSQVAVQLPSGSTLTVSKLKLVTAFGESPVNETGIASRQAASSTATEGIAVSMVTNSTGKAVFFALTAGGAVHREVNASTTAEALVLCDPCFSGLSAEKMVQARQIVASHPRLGELVLEIETSIRNNPQAPLDPDIQPSLVQISAEITTDALNQLFPSTSPSIREAGQQTDSLYVLDDLSHATGDVFCYNETAAYYQVSVWLDGQKIRPPDTRLDTFTLSHKTMMESVFGGQAVSLKVSLGNGKLGFRFDKDSDFTIAEAVIKCFSSVVGLPMIKGNQLSGLISAAATKSLLKVVVAAYTANSQDKKAAFSAMMSLLYSDVGKAFVSLFYQQYSETAYESGWAIFGQILKFAGKKFPLVLATQAVYSSGELGWVIGGCILAPESYEEGGWQLNGKYPFELLAPVNVIAVAGNAKVTVSWAAVTGATGYRVYWQDSAGVATPTAQKVDITGTSFTVPNLTNDKTYYFVVTAKVTDLESGKSSEVSKKPTSSHFTRDADGVITDNSTDGLQWFKAPYPSIYPSKYYTWYNAKDWAEGLAVGGGGWKMPTMKQLRPLYPEAYPTGFFPFWTWSADIKNPTDDPATSYDDSTAWYFSTSSGNEDWCIRDGNSYRNTVAVRSRR
ncbi:MAG: fibronectin type III domain-containing protein [Candidatus Ozemobacteraceae bacterium]